MKSEGSHGITSCDMNMNVSENMKTQGLNLRTTYIFYHLSINTHATSKNKTDNQVNVYRQTDRLKGRSSTLGRNFTLVPLQGWYISIANTLC